MRVGMPPSAGRSPGLGFLAVIAQQRPGDVEKRIADRRHLPVHDRRQPRVPVGVHDVGELVVAVHARREVGGRLRRNQSEATSRSRQLAHLERVQEGTTAVDLGGSWKPSGLPKPANPWAFQSSPAGPASLRPSMSWKARPRRAWRSVSNGRPSRPSGSSRRSPHQVNGLPSTSPLSSAATSSACGTSVPFSARSGGSRAAVRSAAARRRAGRASATPCPGRRG